jgi:1-acyl-sn-glycerol-3-phosphate acyltransferase
MVVIRSTLFLLLVSLWTIPFGVLVTLAIALPITARYAIIAFWRSGFMALSRHVLGIRYQVIGRENIPARPSIVLAKHQAAWETVGLQEVFFRRWSSCSRKSCCACLSSAGAWRR